MFFVFFCFFQFPQTDLGEWSSWSDYSECECSTTCDTQHCIGKRIKRRSCLDDNKRDLGTENCDGSLHVQDTSSSACYVKREQCGCK